MRTFTVLILVVAIANVASAAFGQTVAHWTFEEGTVNTVAEGEGSILDSVGGLHGTPFNLPVYRATDTPNGGTVGLEFVDPDDRVFVPDDPALALTGSLTLEVIIKADGVYTTEGWYNYIVFYGDDRGGLDPYRLALNQDGHLVFHILEARSVESAVTSPDPITFGRLLHVAGTLDDDTGEQKLFIDEIEVNSTTTSVRPFGALDPTSNPGIGIGNLQSDALGFVEPFDGIIAELRVSDEALTPDQFLSSVPPPPPYIGDANGDGCVNDVDVSILAGYWSLSGHGYPADFNDDGCVNDVDVSILAATWKTGCVASAVPEPMTLTLLGLGGLLTARRK